MADHHHGVRVFEINDGTLAAALEAIAD